jgi:hypothetical protein
MAVALEEPRSDGEGGGEIPARVASVVAGSNAALIAEVAKLYLKPYDLVIDLTYGKGNFWKLHQPPYLFTNDLDRSLEEVRYHEDFRMLPADWSGTFDVVVFDPPYTSTGSKATSTVQAMYDAYGLGKVKGWRRIFADMTLGIHQSARIVAPGGTVWVKCCDYVESQHKRWGHKHVLEQCEAAGLELTDEFVFVSGTGPQPARNLDGSIRRQQHAHRAHSFLVIATKPAPRSRKSPAVPRNRGQ